MRIIITFEKKNVFIVIEKLILKINVENCILNWFSNNSKKKKRNKNNNENEKNESNNEYVFSF